MEMRFLGTGGAMSARRAPACTLIDGRILVDCGPTGVVRLKESGCTPDAVDAVFVTHFHGDHTFGLPFLLIERAFRGTRGGTLHLVGPAGVEAHVRGMLDLAFPGCEEVLARVAFHEDVAGTVRGVDWEARAVSHGEMDARGYRLRLDGVTLGFSGDSGPCDALYLLSQDVDAFVLEMNCQTRSFPGHMNRDDVVAFLRRTTARRVLLTHLDDEPREPVAGAEIPDDLARVLVGSSILR
ncbi:MAG: MBL fold metallo-hydrolase [Armatimonadetes bacterium]|nr:MBL fold metallo-hydrolase [Armatimonadota bacterium]